MKKIPHGTHLPRTKAGDTGNKTGFWLEEFAALLTSLKTLAQRFTLASPQSRPPPPRSPPRCRRCARQRRQKRFKGDDAAQKNWPTTKVLSDGNRLTFRCENLSPGGHAPRCGDLAEDKSQHKPESKTFAASDLPRRGRLPMRPRCSKQHQRLATTALVSAKTSHRFSTNNRRRGRGLNDVVLSPC